MPRHPKPTMAGPADADDGAAAFLAPILAAEDSDEDFTALQWAFKKLGIARPMRRCTSGDDLFAYLRRDGAYAAGDAFGAGEINVVRVHSNSLASGHKKRRRTSPKGMSDAVGLRN